MCTPAWRYRVLRYENSSFPGSPKSKVAVQAGWYHYSAYVYYSPNIGLSSKSKY